MDINKLDKLRYKLKKKSYRINRRYRFYDMKNTVKDLNISTPPDLRLWMGSLGWCGKSVDSIADRLAFREFRNDLFNMNQIYELNNPDILFDSANKSALISSCSFIYISPGEDGMPRLQVIDGSSATGNIDPITYLLTEGYAILKRDDYGTPTLEAYFEPYKTTYLQGNKVVSETTHKVPYPLLVPIIYRPDAKRPFGHARISRAQMSIVEGAVRTIKRSEIAAEFYAFPQKYVTGLSQDAEAMDKWKATMSSMIAFWKDEEGDSPTLGQFQQQSMSPHLEQLKMFASLFAGETGLTLEDLGFSNGNPTSSEAIKASHENLRLTTRKAQSYFSTGYLNAGFLAASLRDEFPYERRVLYDTKVVWEPIFEPDAQALTVIGDGALKINQAIEGYVTPEKMRDLTGF